MQVFPRGWPANVEVSDKIEKRVGMTIDDLGRKDPPIVDDVVDEFMRPTALDQGIPKVIVRQQTMVHRDVVRAIADQEPRAVGLLPVAAVVQCLADHRPGDGLWHGEARD